MEQPQAPMGSVVPPPPQIRAFPTGSGLWRIDWFGLVMFPDRLMRARQPSVLVYLSLVVAPDALADPSVLLKPDATWARRQTKRWVSVGTMMLLRIGDIWSDQKLVAAPDYESSVFEKLLIARETTELVKAGVSLDKGSFLLPLGEHPWHGENTQSYCMRVKLEDGRSLIIPCMELIRFYFGSSSALLSRLFDPPMRKENLFSNLAFNPKTKWMRFDLAEGFPRASVGDIARIAGSHTAWMAALRVLTSCMKASTAGQDIYPQAIFPFEGLTDLTATGKWLSLGGRTGQTFIVYHLNVCTHEFPFRSVRYRLAGEPKRRYATQGQGAEAKPRVVKKTDEATESGLVEKDASSTLGAAQVSVRRSRYFPDLERKRLVGGRDLTKPAPTISSGPPVPAVNEVAVGDPGSTRRVRSVMLAECSPLQELVQPAFLKSTVKAMEGLENFEVHLLTASDDDGWTVPIDMLIDEDGVIPSELFIDLDGHPRQRRVAAFSLSHADAHVVLVVVEGERLIPLAFPINAEGLQDPWPALRCAAHDYVSKLTHPHRIDAVFYNGDTPSQRDAIRAWVRDLWE